MRSRDRSRLLADGMLGDLARKLRLLGYDTLYLGGVADSVLLGVASSTGRILVTSDRELYRAAVSSGVEAIYVEGPDLRSVLRRLGASRVRVDPGRAFCPHCNTPVTEVDEEFARGQVPAGALVPGRRFYACFGCGRIYWVGSHWKNIKRMEAELNRQP